MVSPHAIEVVSHVSRDQCPKCRRPGDHLHLVFDFGWNCITKRRDQPLVHERMTEKPAQFDSDATMLLVTIRTELEVSVLVNRTSSLQPVDGLSHPLFFLGLLTDSNTDLVKGFPDCLNSHLLWPPAMLS